MRHEIRHDFDVARSRELVERAFSHYESRFEKYRPEIFWLGDSHARIRFCARGLTVEGDIMLVEGALVVDLDVPFLLRPLRRKAIRVIEREARAWSERAASGT